MATGMKTPTIGVKGMKEYSGTVQPPTPGPASPTSMPIHRAINSGRGGQTNHAGHQGRTNMDRFHVGDDSHDHAGANDGNFDVNSH